MSNSTFVPSQTSRKRRKGARTAERILDAAEELFAEHGFAGTTLRDVAARVGVRNPSLYNHFSNKESLYAAVLERGIGPVLETLSEFVEAGVDSYSDSSSKVVERMMELLAEHPNLPRLVVHETLTGGQRLRPLLRRWIAPTFDRGRQMLEANPAASRWQPHQIPLLVLAFYNIVVGYFTIAPLYKDLAGEDLLTREALDRQTRLLGQLVDTLLAENKEAER